MTTPRVPPPAPADSLSAEALLDALPYGILVLDAERNVVRTSAPARELLPLLQTDSTRTCADLFSCRAPGGPCESGCFTERASRRGRPTSEIRIDAAGGTSPGALWVTAAPLADGRGTVLHLRAGARGDRRRRSEERWQAAPQLRISALGRTRVEAVTDSLESDWLSQKPGQILKYLVCERGRIVMVDEIAEAIWPDRGPRAVANTRYAIHRLRTKLEPRRAAHDPATFVIARAGGYELDGDRIWIDVDEFEQEVELGRAAMARLAGNVAAQHLERAMKLYRGPFMSDEPYGDWAADERNRLAGLAIYALRILIAIARERGDGVAAIEHLQRLAELEPLDIAVHHEFVQALLAEGRLSEAKRRYDTFAHRLRRELGADPGFDLRTLGARATAPDRSG
ncbi:MAG: hypothetical protein QOJ89_880 [bacterium]